MFKFVIKMTNWKEYLSSLYFNPKLPSSYLGPEKLYGIRPQLFPLIGCIENGYNSTQDSSLFNGL